MTTVDADEVFSVTAARLMGEMGLDYDKYTREEMQQFYDCICAASESCWEEFLLWVSCGEDRRERTRLLLRAQMLGGVHGKAQAVH